MSSAAKPSGKRFAITLQTRFFLILAATALVPLAIYTTINQLAGRAALRERAYDALTNAARFNAVKVDGFLSTALVTTEVAANLRELEVFLGEQGDGANGSRSVRFENITETLHRVAGNDRVFIASVALLDRDGWNLADTRRWGVGRNESATPAFMNAMLSGLPSVEVQRFSDGEREDELCFSAPIFAGGRFLGVLRVCYGLAAVRHAIVSGVGMAGPSSFPLVLDEEGRLLVAAFGGRDPGLARLADRLRGMGPASNFSLPLEKGGGPAWMGASAEVENTRWRVVYLQESDFFFAPIQRQFRFLLLICAGLLALVLLLSWFSARRLTAPLYALRDSAERIAAGDWSVRTKGSRSAEIAGLERSFIEMASQLEQREKELMAARSHAETAAQAKADFLAVMSHEVRTPLNTIIGFSALILADDSLKPEHVGYLRKMDSGARQLLVMINEILDFSRLEAGRLDRDQRPFSIEELISDVIQLCGTGPWNKGLEIFVRVGPRTPHDLVGDPHGISQVLANLVNNAVKFTDAGGIVIEAGPSACEGGEPGLRLSVSDTGTGLPESAADKLFEPFTQGDASTRRRYPGTGLGLAICKRLVDALGGSIGIDRTYSGGARFIFSVPVSEVVSCCSFPPPAPGGMRVELLSASRFFKDELTRLLSALEVSVTAFDSGEADVRPLPCVAPLIVHWCDGLAATPAGRAIRAGRFPPPRMPVIVLLQPSLPHSRLPERLRNVPVLNNPVFPWEVSAALRELAVRSGEQSV